MTNFDLYWKLESEENFIESNLTTLNYDLNDEWSIVCVLEKDPVGVWRHTSIELHRKNTDAEISISGSLSVNTNGFSLITRNFRCSIKAGSSFKEVVSDINVKFLENNTICGHVNICDMHAKQPLISAKKESIDKFQLMSLNKLSKDLERILNPEASSFSDVTLKCDGVNIPAHKSILSARSPVFARILTNPKKGNLTNEVDITDVGESILRELLKYMYTGKVSDLTESLASDLLLAADKYELRYLRTICISFLKDSLSLQNVWKVLVLGHLHSEDLKSIAVDFICKNCGEFTCIRKSREWRTLQKERPDLAMELLELLILYRDGKLKR